MSDPDTNSGPVTVIDDPKISAASIIIDGPKICAASIVTGTPMSFKFVRPERFCIGSAVLALEEGHRVARAGWNGKGMWLELQVPDAHSKMSLPYVFMKTACGNRVPWLCSQSDLLAKDWEIVS